MRVIGSRLIVAFDAAAVSGAVASWGLRGLRVHAACRLPLAPGALVPSPLDPNLARPDEVRDALREARKSLGTNGRRAVLVLPDGVARVLLVQPEPGVAGHEYARFRVAQGLPFPAGEAITGVVAPGGGGPLLAAAVRRSVVRGYEEAAAAAGFGQDRLDLAPLAALSGLVREAGAGRDVALILGDVALCLALFEAGALRAFRCRRRDTGPGEAARLRDEVERTAALAGPGSAPRVKVVGHGAVKLARDLSSLGAAADAGWRSSDAGSPSEAAEMAFLGAARP
jgi:hypothetical protein